MKSSFYFCGITHKKLIRLVFVFVGSLQAGACIKTPDSVESSIKSQDDTESLPAIFTNRRTGPRLPAMNGKEFSDPITLSKIEPMGGGALIWLPVGGDGSGSGVGIINGQSYMPFEARGLLKWWKWWEEPQDSARRLRGNKTNPATREVVTPDTRLVISQDGHILGSTTIVGMAQDQAAPVDDTH
jgi:hypothetical protein